MADQNQAIQLARRAVDHFRDFARMHGMDHRTRDPLVMEIHAAIDLAAQAAAHQETIQQLKEAHLKTKLDTAFVFMRLGNALHLKPELDGASLEDFTRASEAAIEHLEAEIARLKMEHNILFFGIKDILEGYTIHRDVYDKLVDLINGVKDRYDSNHPTRSSS